MVEDYQEFLEQEILPQLAEILDVDPSILEVSVTKLNEFNPLKFSGMRVCITVRVKYQHGASFKEYVYTNSLIPLPGNASIVVSTDAYVCHLFRNKGIGKLMLLAREMFFAGDENKEIGAILATVSSSNVAEKRILASCGYELLTNKLASTWTPNKVEMHVLYIK